MIRIVSLRSAWATTSSWPIADAPIVRNLCSSAECSRQGRLSRMDHRTRL